MEQDLRYVVEEGAVQDHTPLVKAGGIQREGVVGMAEGGRRLMGVEGRGAGRTGGTSLRSSQALSLAAEMMTPLDSGQTLQSGKENIKPFLRREKSLLQIEDHKTTEIAIRRLKS